MPKKEKKDKIKYFEELVVLTGGLEAFPDAFYIPSRDLRRSGF
jgi:hypothetical protein